MRSSFRHVVTALLGGALGIAAVALAQTPLPAVPSAGEPVAVDQATGLSLYTLIIHEPTDRFAQRFDPERSAAYWSAFSDYAGRLTAANALVGGAPLQSPSHGWRLTSRDGKIETQPLSPDGQQQFAGGYMIIRAKSIDEALQWARQCPAVFAGSVEVRANLPHPPCAQ